MKQKQQAVTMATNTTEGATSWPELHRELRTLVVVDVVESVRLMQQHEDDVIDRWRRFVNEVRTEVLPNHGGRMVKSLGDGMLLAFDSVPGSVAAAFDIAKRIGTYNTACDDDGVLRLRLGAHVSNVVVDEFDVYGAGVNLAARLATLAQPGELIASSEVCDGIVVGIDASISDLGDCWLKHLPAPVRAFRLERPDSASGCSEPVGQATSVLEHMVPTVAVVPLAGDNPQELLIGDLLADGVIAQLSMTADLRVISRLSTTQLRGRSMPLSELAATVGADYVFSGRCAEIKGRLVMMVEVADASSGSVQWAERLTCMVGDLLQPDCEVIDRLAQACHACILRSEAKRASIRPLPNLEGYSLLLGGIGLLHRSSADDFGRARDALVALSERVPRHGSAYAWIAKWHCLRMIRGLAASTDVECSEARWRIKQALDRDSSNATAWCLHGLVHGFFGKDLTGAEASYEQALAINPNEPLAWLYTATLRSWQGRGPEAAAAADRALKLSPIDPMRYYFDSLAAAGYLADEQLERAIECCRRSMRANRGHTPTYRVMAIAQMLLGKGDEARDTVAAMLVIEPALTVSKYLARYPGGAATHAQRYASALRDSGLPI